MLDCAISFSLWWTMVRMAIYTQKWSKNDWKLIIGEFGIKMSWVEKNRKINNWGYNYSRLESKVESVIYWSYHIDNLNDMKKSNKFPSINEEYSKRLDIEEQTPEKSRSSSSTFISRPMTRLFKICYSFSFLLLLI